jgi:hypothetical protein
MLSYRKRLFAVAPFCRTTVSALISGYTWGTASISQHWSTFAEARVALELAPWNGTAYNSAKPESPMRTLSFGPEGQGDIVYLGDRRDTGETRQVVG